ncbi:MULTISPECIES: SMP-30/gluconolactonase/LRE family protein [unclassified Sphingobium]|uniref:SMP-30/gluconolactonase/LRE family protein n=1 Tax=unclassified Sphingobium TaxID=2611147 RepID=UPI0035A698F0
MASVEPQSVLSVGATLGEGPAWVARDAALWFVDIKEHRVHRYDPALDAGRSWTAPGQVGWILPTDDGLFAAGLQSGVHRFDPTDGSFTPLHAPEAHLPGNRQNDATVAPDGAIWFGTMDDGEELTSGRFYRLHKGVCADVGLPPFSITNGPALSPDGRILYHTDTLGKRIWQCALQDGKVVDRPTIFATIEDGTGWPDGPTVDAEGCVWTGLFGGWAVRRYDPAGTLMREIRFPVANITKIAFGGEGLRTAYATTARKGLDMTALTVQPLAGDLFAFDPGVAGLPGIVATI